MITAYSYARVSSTKQVEGSGIERQVVAAQAWAAQHGTTLTRFVDEGISAYSGKNRTRGALAKFLVAAKAGQLGPNPHLIVEQFDRLSREPAIDSIRTILDGLIDCGVSIVILQEGGAVYSRQTLQDDPSRLLMMVMRLQGAHLVSSSKGARVAQAHAAARARGEAKNALPAWLTRTPEGIVENEHAATVRRIFDLAEAGLGGYRIAKELNRTKTPTLGTSKEWTTGTISTLMRRRSVCGELQSKSGEPIGTYPAVISPERFDALQAARASRTRIIKPSGAIRYLGQGITTCSKCTHNVGINSSTSRGKGKARHWHARCATPGCTPGGWRVDALNQHLLERLTPKAMQMLLARPADTEAAATKLQHSKAALQQAKRSVAAVRSKIDSAIADPDADYALVKTLQHALTTAEKALRGTQADHDAAHAAWVKTTTTEPIPDTSGVDLDSDTARQDFNAALRRWGLRVSLDRDRMRVGMALPGRETVWARFDPNWWTDFAWIGPPDDSAPPSWSPNEAEYQYLESLRKDLL